jgi:hypothetical protein
MQHTSDQTSAYEEESEAVPILSYGFAYFQPQIISFTGHELSLDHQANTEIS